MKVCVDLCSGTGAASQAFVDAGWEVHRYENNPRFKDVPYTEMADVRELASREPQVFKPREVMVLWASPPCQHFSVAGLPRGWPRRGIYDALSVVGACLEIVARWQPTYWMMENPRGMLRKVIGKLGTTVHYSDFGAPYQKPTDLWGNLPLGMVDSVKPYEAAPRGSKTGVQGIVRDPALRAKVPYGLSQAILEAVSVEPLDAKPSKGLAERAR